MAESSDEPPVIQTFEDAALETGGGGADAAGNGNGASNGDSNFADENGAEENGKTSSGTTSIDNPVSEKEKTANPVVRTPSEDVFEQEKGDRPPEKKPPEGDNVVAGRALFCLPEDSPLRLKLNAGVTHPIADNFLLVCILVNTVILAIQTPTNTLGTDTNDALDLVDHFLSFVFSVEMVVRIIALGLVLHEHSYLRNPWNILDFVVVMSIWVGVVVHLVGIEGDTNISYLRTLRALRPLRSLRFFSGIRVIMSSLAAAAYLVANVTGILAFTFAIFAAVGLQLFAGALTQRCATPEELASNMTEASFIPFMRCSHSMGCEDKARCVDLRPEYEHSGDLPDEIFYYGFDNLATSFVSLFIAMTMDEWAQISDPIRTSDVVAKSFAWPMYAMVVLVAGLVVSNLFIAVITFTFARVRDEQESAFAAENPEPEDSDLSVDDGQTPVPDEHVKVALLDGSTIVIAVNVIVVDDDDDSDLVFEVKTKVQDLGGGAVDEQRMVCNGIQLVDDKTLFQQQVERGASLKLVPLKPMPFIPGLSPAMNAVAYSDVFNNFILFIVILNTCSLSAEHYEQTQLFTDRLWLCDLVFNIIYINELLIKWLGMGWKQYFGIPFNCLDFGIVCASLAQYAFSNLEGAGAARMLRVLRLFRAARLIRVLRKYDSVMALLKTVLGSMTALLNVCLFNGVMLVIFGIMGVHLYGFDTPFFEEHGLPSENFHSFGRAFLTCFQILTGEDWSPLMFVYMKAFGWTCSFYFLGVFIFTNFVMVNLFVAVILENFEVDDDYKMQKQKRLYLEDQKRKGKEVAGISSEEAVTGGQEKGFFMDLCCPEEDLHYCPGNCAARVQAKAISTNPWFEAGIIVVIVLSSIALAVEGPPNAPYLRPYPNFRIFLEVTDVTFFFIFWIECLLKVVGNGFMCTKGAYLTDGWNRLDFTVVFFTTVDFTLRYIVTVEGDASWARVFRMLRVLRPLRIASKFDNIRVIIDALISSISGVMATIALALFFLLLFAILGLNFFSGKFWSCGGEGGDVEPPGMYNRTECAAAGEEWLNADQHFDDIGYAFECLFITATLEGWVDIMNNAIAVPPEIGMAPIADGWQDGTPAYGVYFVVFVIFCSFFITNLFVGVLVAQFQESTGSAIMTEDQQRWQKFNMLIWMASMTRSQEDLDADLVDAAGLKKVLSPIVNNAWFERSVSSLIITNVGLLLAEHFPQEQSFTDFVSVANTVFLILFTVEIVLQIGASSPIDFWASHWSKVDFFVVASSWFFTLANVQAGVQGARAVRLLRILMLFKAAKTIRSMVMTVLVAIPPAINVAAAVLLVLYIYAVAGMQFYGELELDAETKISKLENFQNIFTSMMFLYQIATGQDLKSLITDVRAQDGFAIFGFICSFYIVCIFVFLNLFVAVLLEAFEREFDDTIKVDVTPEDLSDLKARWDAFIRALVADGKITPKAGGLCTKTGGNKTLPLRYIKEFVESIPEEAPMAACRQLEEGVWLNRLLLEQDLVPSQIHEAWQKQGPEIVLDEKQLEFVAIAQSLALMRTTVLMADLSPEEALAGLSYGERLEKEAILAQKKEECALGLIEVQVRAWKALRSPAAEFLEPLATDPGYREVYARQVEIARTLMFCTVISRTKVG